MDRTVPESSIIIEYLDQHYPGETRFLPADPDLARQTRMRDRFFDLYLQLPMQKVVGDRLRPAEKRDAFGVEQAKSQLQTALGMVDGDMATKTWAMGDAFSMADCAAVPALYYANLVTPFTSTHKHAAAYLDRLMNRPSVARTVKEAEPYRTALPAIAHVAKPERNNAQDPRDCLCHRCRRHRRRSGLRGDQARHVSRAAGGEHQGAAREDLSAPQRPAQFRKLVALREEGPGDEAHPQRRAERQGGGVRVGRRQERRQGTFGDCGLFPALQGHARFGYARAIEGSQHRRCSRWSRRAIRPT